MSTTQFQDTNKEGVIKRYNAVLKACKKAEGERDLLKQQNTKLRADNGAMLAANTDLSDLRLANKHLRHQVATLEAANATLTEERDAAVAKSERDCRDQARAQQVVIELGQRIQVLQEKAYAAWGVMEDQIQFALQNFLEETELVQGNEEGAEASPDTTTKEHGS